MSCKLGLKRYFSLCLVLGSLGCASQKQSAEMTTVSTPIATSQAIVPDFAIASPTEEQPVTAGMLCQRVSNLEVQALIKLKLAPGYYLHAPEPASAAEHSPGNALDIKLDLPKGVYLADSIQYPRPLVEYDHPIYRDEVLIHARLTAEDSDVLQDGRKIKALVRQQVCSETTCRPPQEINLSTTL